MVRRCGRIASIGRPPASSWTLTAGTRLNPDRWFLEANRLAKLPADRGLQARLTTGAPAGPEGTAFWCRKPLPLASLGIQDNGHDLVMCLLSGPSVSGWIGI